MLDFSAPPDPPQTTLLPEYGCGKDEYSYRGFCYTLVDTLQTFDEMKDICSLRGSDLVSVADKSEMDYVISLMQTGKPEEKNTIILKSMSLIFSSPFK